MRPFELDPLFRSVSTLPGVGPRNQKLLEKLVNGPKVVDLLWHLPVDFIDRRAQPRIAAAEPGKVATIKIKVQKHMRPQRRGAPFRIMCEDETGVIAAVFFRGKPDWIEKQLPLGEERYISGVVERFQDSKQISHPDIMPADMNISEVAVCEPVYPLTQGITNKIFRKILGGALELVPELSEWQDPSFVKQRHWPNWANAVRSVHKIEDEKSLLPEAPDRLRLAYDELLSNQLALALVRQSFKKKKGRSFPIATELRKKLEEVLPFQLTGAQKRSIQEIDDDMVSSYRMLRLLQGDVGSGKTIVAVMSVLNVVTSGVQAAIMAPTEILARQHEQTIAPWLDALGISYVTLTGRDKGKKREALLEQIASGEAQVVIGTHALFQDSIVFADLGLAVIDEQHRFGVHQRLKLSEKGKGVDVLVMTATPIPRSLTLTAFGDMEVSRLDEKPPGRKPIDTRLISTDHLPQLVDSLSREIEKGTQIYWVCPLVEESEVVSLAAAEERYTALQQLFGDKVGLVHGRMKAEEKDDVMRRFAANEISILIATTVIEVGVNVPNATIMVIEHAERFGLAQLHQLRGRVGRGDKESFCFLLYQGPLSETGKERLAVMRQTEDGFVIAEKDLELRGAGDLLGTQQSGLPKFKTADLEHHKDLLQIARDDAKLILEKDPDLGSERGKALRVLLYLFERDQSISYLRSG